MDFLLTVLEVGKPQIKAPVGLMSGKSLLLDS